MRSTKFMAEAIAVRPHGAVPFDSVSQTHGVSLRRADGTVLRLVMDTDTALWLTGALLDDVQRARNSCQSDKSSGSRGSIELTPAECVSLGQMPDVVPAGRPAATLPPAVARVTIDMLADGRMAIEAWAGGRWDCTYALCTVDKALKRCLPEVLGELAEKYVNPPTDRG